MPITFAPAAYSVLLARPDYLPDGTTDTYFTTVWGATVEAAVATARLEAATTDGIEEGNLTDYAVLLVVAGDHADINPERGWA